MDKEVFQYFKIALSLTADNLSLKQQTSIRLNI